MKAFLSSRGRVETEIARLICNEIGGMSGNIFFVDYTNGSDASGNGYNIRKPLKTLNAAYDLCKDRYGDIVAVIGNATNTGGTSNYVASELVWAKNNTHLIGVGSPATLNGRVRVTHISGFTAAAGALLTVSADGCLFKGVTFYDGLSFANRKVLNVTGNRNKFQDCSFLGMEGALAAADAGSTHVAITGGQENLFENCWIGTDTIQRSAANSSVLLRSAAARNEFRNCRFRCWTSSASSVFIDANGVAAIDRSTDFYDCKFLNYPTGKLGSSVTMTVAIATNASMGGIINLGCATIVTGCTKWDASGLVFTASEVPTAATSGLSVATA